MTHDEQPVVTTPLEALEALVATEGWDWEYFCDCESESWDGYHYENCPAWMVEVALRNAGIDVGEIPSWKSYMGEN
jgi:hypothetical protein